MRNDHRIRRGSTALKQLEIPAQVPEEAEAKASTPALSTSDSSSSPPSPPDAQACEPMTMDVDTDTEVGTDSGFESVTYLKSTHKDDIQFTDFSNFLGITMQEDSDSSLTIVNSEMYNPLHNVDDIYGWDADYETKFKYGVTADRVCGCDYQHAKSFGTKRNLLHRVFSMQTSRRHAQGF